MAKLTYQDKVDLYENANVQRINKVVADDMNEIKEVVNDNENKILLAISDTAPSECSVGDLYYNTSTKKVYEAIDVDTWDANGTDPTPNTIYILFDTKTTYSYDGTELVSVGGGGDEIFVGDTLPSGEDADSIKLWLTDDDALDGEGNYISNEYGTSQEIGYAQEYANEHYGGVVLWENPNPTSNFSASSITLPSNTCTFYDIIYRVNKSLDYQKIERVINDTKGLITLPSTEGFSAYNLSRWITTISNTTITFEDGKAGTSTDNSFIIPIKVIGYK